MADLDNAGNAFDNFYSPRNVAFYQRSPYTPLDASRREVRLISLFPGDGDDPLVCELLAPRPLDQIRSSYMAISYCAGDPAVTMNVTVSGRAFNAFANLGFALQRVRATTEASGRQNGRPQYFWVDQICINQSNPAERAHQVGLMRHIYEGAGRVMIWLGGETSDGIGLRWLDARCENVEDLARNALTEDDPTSLETVTRYAAETLGQTFANDYFTLPDFIESWRGVREVVTSPWWKRCWVAQELIVSRETAIFQGAGVMTWARFRVAFGVIRSVVDTLIKMYASRGAEELPEGEELAHLQAMLNSFDLGGIEFLMKQNEDWQTGEPLNLRPLLEYSRGSLSGDPRDRVYAFLGLATPNYNIVPSYEAANSVQDTLCHTAKRMILHDASLDILSLASEVGRAEDSDLPSWVPNWCVEKKQEVLLDGDYEASQKYPAVASFHPNIQGQMDRVLRVQGLMIDQVATQSTLSEPYQSPAGRTVGRIVSSWAPLANIDLERLHEPVDASGSYFTGESVVEAFLATVHIGRQEKATDRAEAEAEEGELMAQRRNEHREWRNRMLLETATSEDRRFFRSPEGYMGVADSRSRCTDLIVVLIGASVPFVLRKVGESYRLVGEAYVHGFMDGEAIRMMKAGKLEVESFDII